MTIIPSSSATQAQEARLRELRKDAGLTGRTLAATTGQHFTRVSKIEHGVQALNRAGGRDQVGDLVIRAAGLAPATDVLVTGVSELS